MQLRCGGVCNSHFIANFSQSVSVIFFNRLMFAEDIDESQLARVLWPTVYIATYHMKKMKYISLI